MPRKGSWIVAWREDTAEGLDKLAEELGARDKTGDVILSLMQFQPAGSSVTFPP